MVNVKIVNITASGDIGREIDVEQLTRDVDLPVADFDSKAQAAFLRFIDDKSPLVILYRTGKFIIRGGNSHEKLNDVHNRYTTLLENLDIIDETSEADFTILNVVCLGDIGEPIDLNKAVLKLGLEQTEYEPEQFPGLVYRPNSPCVLLIFNSGKTVIAGARTRDEARKAFQDAKLRLLE